MIIESSVGGELSSIKKQGAAIGEGEMKIQIIESIGQVLDIYSLGYSVNLFINNKEKL